MTRAALIGYLSREAGIARRERNWLRFWMLLDELEWMILEEVS